MPGRNCTSASVHGLTKKHSWTLDQNALTYLAEKAEGRVRVLNIAAMKRPIVNDGLAPKLKALRRGFVPNQVPAETGL